MSPEELIKTALKFPYYWKVRGYKPDFNIQKTVHSIGDFGKDIEFEYCGDLYKNNSHGVRCDEFKKDHDKKHILFAGCSITIGTGLAKEETWAHRVYEKIKNTEGASGYYNIGIPGGATSDIILSEIMKYCRQFGNPDVMFVMLPGTDREYRFLNSEKALKESIFRYYLVLDQYCRSSGIKLYAFTWTQSISKVSQWVHDDWMTYDFLYENFDTFYKIDEDKFKEEIYTYEKLNKDDKKSFLASDNDHPGNMWHFAWSNFIYRRYCENN